ncbi:MAG: aminopeptidase [Thermoanaerobaculaceae bacterium]|nr:aminopeptidase [Thermoanaerobaculaceae bacterium]MDI9621440.1 aminopeptidase [Acidobacteriota bacterium]NLH12339.1 aminopeptidase [Holophagae bacterium]HPW55489.1 aminopeptidase [Thermoanaerobaculaceae bacterium]
MTELGSAALTALRDCLGLRPSETLLILTDPPMAELARVFARVARALAREVLVTEYSERELNGQEPPPPVPALMAAVDVVLAVTSRSITHTAARRAATASGGRVATMPGLTQDCLIRTMNADYRAIAERSHRVAEMLTRARVAHLSSDHGTDLTLPIDGIVAIASTGLILHRGQWGNLPSGEAYLRPLEGRSEGVLVVDGSLAGLGKLTQPVRITVREGVAVGVDGGEEAERFSAQLEHVGPLARSVAELGVGTNDRAVLTGNILEDEKILGTVHIAFGNNTSLGGSVDVPFHVDGIVLYPTLTLDGQVVIDRGVPRF